MSEEDITWEDAAKDPRFDKLSYDQKRRGAERYFSEKIASDPRFGKLSPKVQAQGKQKFLATLGPEPLMHKLGFGPPTTSLEEPSFLRDVVQPEFTGASAEKAGKLLVAPIVGTTEKLVGLAGHIPGLHDAATAVNKQLSRLDLTPDEAMPPAVRGAGTAWQTAYKTATGMAELPGTLAKYEPAMKLLGPIGGFAAIGALDEGVDKEGNVNIGAALKGGGINALMGVIMPYAGTLKSMALRTIGGGVVGSVGTALEGGDVSDIVSSGLTMAVLFGMQKYVPPETLAKHIDDLAKGEPTPEGQAAFDKAATDVRKRHDADPEGFRKSIRDYSVAMMRLQHEEVPARQRRLNLSGEPDVDVPKRNEPPDPFSGERIAVEALREHGEPVSPDVGARHLDVAAPEPAVSEPKKAEDAISASSEKEVIPATPAEPAFEVVAGKKNKNGEVTYRIREVATGDFVANIDGKKSRTTGLLTPFVGTQDAAESMLKLLNIKAGPAKMPDSPVKSAGLTIPVGTGGTGEDVARLMTAKVGEHPPDQPTEVGRLAGADRVAYLNDPERNPQVKLRLLEKERNSLKRSDPERATELTKQIDELEQQVYGTKKDAVTAADEFEQARKTVKAVSKEAVLNEIKALARGSDKKGGVKLTMGIDPFDAVPHLQLLGRKLWEEGKTKYDEWHAVMKESLGELWERFKDLMGRVYAAIRKDIGNQKGYASFTSYGANIREALARSRFALPNGDFGLWITPKGEELHNPETCRVHQQSAYQMLSEIEPKRYKSMRPWDVLTESINKVGLVRQRLLRSDGGVWAEVFGGLRRYKEGDRKGINFSIHNRNLDGLGAILKKVDAYKDFFDYVELDIWGKTGEDEAISGSSYEVIKELSQYLRKKRGIIDTAWDYAKKNLGHGEGTPDPKWLADWQSKIIASNPAPAPGRGLFITPDGHEVGDVMSGTIHELFARAVLEKHGMKFKTPDDALLFMIHQLQFIRSRPLGHPGEPSGWGYTVAADNISGLKYVSSILYDTLYDDTKTYFVDIERRTPDNVNKTRTISYGGEADNVYNQLSAFMARSGDVGDIIRELDPARAFLRGAWADLMSNERGSFIPGAEIGGEGEGAVAPKPGPGAMTAGATGELPPELTQFNEVLGRMEPQKERSFAQRLATAEEVGGKQAGKSPGEILAPITVRAEGLVAGLTEIIANPSTIAEKFRPAFTAYKRLVGRYGLAVTRASHEVKAMSKELTRLLPDKHVQNAIAKYVVAGGDVEQLKKWAAGSKDPALKKMYLDATRLTDQEKRVADHVSSFYDGVWQQLHDAGVLDAYVENYVARYWKRDASIVRDDAARTKFVSEYNSGVFRKNPSLLKKRLFETEFEAEQARYRQRDYSIGYRMGRYYLDMAEALSTRAAIRQGFNEPASDDRPMFAVSGMGKVIGPEGDQRYVIKPHAKPADSSDYMPISHPAMRKYKWATTTESGDGIVMEGDILVHPEAYKDMKAFLEPSSVRNWAIKLGDKTLYPGRALLGLSTEVKSTLLSMSGFHIVQVGTHATFHRTNPFKIPEMDLEAVSTIGGVEGKHQSALIEHGMTASSHNNFEQFAEGLYSTGLINRMPGVGKYMQRMGHWMFEEYIPRLKMQLGLNILERNMKTYGAKLTLDEIYDLTAKEANNALGEQNYKYMGRSKTSQDVFRLIALAPDFFESRAKFLGQALTPYGKEQRVALLTGALGMFFVARILNQMLDGKANWDKPFSVVADGKEYTIRSIPGDLVHFLSDPRGFAMWRLNPTTVRLPWEVLTQRDQYGRKRDLMGQVQDAISFAAPIPLQGALPTSQKTMWQSFLSAFGVSSYKHREGALQAEYTIGREADTGRVSTPHSREVAKLRSKIWEGEYNPTLIDEALKSNKITRADAHELRRHRKETEIQYHFRHLPGGIDKAFEVWEAATPDEKKELRREMHRKIRSAKHRAASTEQEVIDEKWRALEGSTT